MTKNTNDLLSLDAMRDIVVQLPFEESLIGLYQAGDRKSRFQTKHNAEHAISVMKVAKYLLKEMQGRFPDRFDDSSELVVLAAAFFHDIGRAVAVDDHADAGRKIAYEYLSEKGFLPELAGKVAAIVSRHRSNDFLKIPLETLRTFPELAIVVISDKCVGDEDRVRFWRALSLRILRRLGLSHLNLWHNSEHDRANFSIKETTLIVDSDENFSDEHAGAIILKLTVDVAVADAELILGLYGRRFQACDFGAKSMGFAFRIEVNGVRYYYESAADKWCQLDTFKIALA